MKTCCKCEILKSFSEFHKNKRSPDGYKARCKVCRNIENKQHRELNPDYYKKYRIDNAEQIKLNDKKYREENKGQLKAKKQEYINNNKELVAARKKSWYEQNRERILREKKKRYERDSEKIIAREAGYRRNSIQARLRANLRSRLGRAIKGKYRAGSAVGDLGCSIEEFKKYIERRFESKMTWENYGEWHLDHRIPLSSFDLTDREQVKQACHYTNLQPLWAEDNLRKGAQTPNQGE